MMKQMSKFKRGLFWYFWDINIFGANFAWTNNAHKSEKSPQEPFGSSKGVFTVIFKTLDMFLQISSKSFPQGSLQVPLLKSPKNYTMKRIRINPQRSLHGCLSHILHSGLHRRFQSSIDIISHRGLAGEYQQKSQQRPQKFPQMW